MRYYLDDVVLLNGRYLHVSKFLFIHIYTCLFAIIRLLMHRVRVHYPDLLITVVIQIVLLRRYGLHKIIAFIY